jgi:hypothetical protein
MSEDIFNLEKTQNYILFNFFINSGNCESSKKVVEYLKLDNKTHEKLKYCMGEQNYNNFVSQIQKIDKNYFCGKCARMGVSTEATQKCPKCHCLCDNCIHNHDCDTKSFAFGYDRKYLLVRNYKRVDTENYEMEIIPCEAEKPNHLNTYFLNRDKLVIMFNDFVVEFDKNEDYSFDRFV